MKLQRILQTAVIFSFSTSTGALPFRTRGKSNDTPNAENEVTKADAVIYDGAQIIDIGFKTDDRRNAVVEAYFVDTTNADTAESVSSQRLAIEIKDKAKDLEDFLVYTRRVLHRHPELMYNEKVTSGIVEKVLTDLGVSYTTGWAKNKHPTTQPGPGGFGIVADIGTGQEPCVLLRADMDALPIFEQTTNIDDFRSIHDNVMHACGHDGHTTMLLGAAAILKSMEKSINGTVRLMFQPAEEGGAGGKRMREEGVLQLSPKPQYAFGMHLWPTLPSGSIAGKPGPLLAACERFEVLISGVGGHAAMPHLTVDPIVTASAIVMNLQTVVSRILNPLEPGVVSITKIEAGDAFNIIPASALLRGTIRAQSTDTLLTLRDRVEQIIESTASVHGCNVTLTYSEDYYPSTVNDPVLYETFSKTVANLVSREGYIRDVEPTMGAEDFSFIAETVPSSFFLLGQGSGQDPPTNFGLHHPHFAIDESVLPVGVELHVNLALRALRRLQQQKDGVALI